MVLSPCMCVCMCFYVCMCVFHLVLFNFCDFVFFLFAGVLPPASQAGWRGSHTEPSDTSAQGRQQSNTHYVFQILEKMSFVIPFILSLFKYKYYRIFISPLTEITQDLEFKNHCIVERLHLVCFVWCAVALPSFTL